MCYDDNAMPPTPPGAGETALGEDIILTAAGETPFAAYVAHPASPKNAQVLIYPDVRGLHRFYKELALRFAEVGITATAIDYFGRTAGIGSRDESFEYMPHVQQIRLKSFFADVAAALAYLRSGEGVQRSTFTVGFCMGGLLSFLTGTRQEFDLAGVIGFYSGMSRKFEGARGTLLDEARYIVYPALGLFGGDDSSIPEDKVRAFDEELDRAGVEHEVIIYPGAPHSFFDKRATEFAEASADAWQRVLGFISAHTKEK
jgi:carboxymethylenebutenolidase